MNVAELHKTRGQWVEVDERWQRHRLERVYRYQEGELIDRRLMPELFKAVVLFERIGREQERTIYLAQSGRHMESYRVRVDDAGILYASFEGSGPFWVDGYELLGETDQIVLHLARDKEVPRQDIVKLLDPLAARIPEVYEMLGVYTSDLEWLSEVRPKNTKINYLARLRDAQSRVYTSYNYLVQTGRIRDSHEPEDSSEEVSEPSEEYSAPP